MFPTDKVTFTVCFTSSDKKKEERSNFRNILLKNNNFLEEAKPQLCCLVSPEALLLESRKFDDKTLIAVFTYQMDCQLIIPNESQ